MYWPISNLYLISKIVKHVVKSRFMDHLTSNSRTVDSIDRQWDCETGHTTCGNSDSHWPKNLHTSCYWIFTVVIRHVYLRSIVVLISERREISHLATAMSNSERSELTSREFVVWKFYRCVRQLSCQSSKTRHRRTFASVVCGGWSQQWPT